MESVMAQVADRVYVDQEDIQSLEKWARDLAVNARVRIHLRNRDRVEGTVAATPTVQIFRDPHGEEGVNGVVKLIEVGEPGSSAIVWLDTIDHVDHLDGVTMGSSRA